MQKQTERLIELYRVNALTKTQARELTSWLGQSEENRALFRKIVTTEVPSLSPPAQEQWERFASQHKILFSTPTVHTNLWARVRIYTATAAAVAALGCAGWFWNSGSTAAPDLSTSELATRTLEYHTGRGERRDVVLPDGSSVCMNSEASLSIAADFGRTSRQIEFDGEGFFTITPNADCPFIIHSGSNNYTVLGTSFNLQSYTRENYSVVTLHTGRLQAQVKKDVIILNPNDELEVDAEANTISKRAVQVDNSIGWLKGRLVFTGNPLKDVAHKLSRFYQVKINIHHEITNLKFNGTVDNESLQEALCMLAETAPVRLAVSNIDGEYYLSRAKN